MPNSFYNYIESAISRIPDKQILAKTFLSQGANISRYVIGKNEQSEMLIKTFKIDGIIDDYAAVQTVWNKIPVIKSTAIPVNAIVVNCSTSISPVSVARNLSEAGVQNLLNLHELIYASDNRIPLPSFQDQMKKDYTSNASEWLKLYQLMSDEESKMTLIDIVRYRLTADPVYMKGYSVRLNQQYFEDFMNYSSEVFVDIGGFDGDTTEEFCRRYNNYKKVFLFEPSEENISAAISRLSKLFRIEFIQCGLSDKTGQLSFNPTAGSASAVTENGDTTIEVTTLDFKIKEPVSFIKMDIEGWELKALEGSRNHIINDNPKLAIAVYHNSKDFYEIPNFILSINPHYDLYLRHYTEGWSETVMYFVPKKRT